MRHRTLGRTGLEVSELGFGAWEIGWTPLGEGDEVHTAIVGTTNLEHLKENIASVERGGLADDICAAVAAVR